MAVLELVGGTVLGALIAEASARFARREERAHVRTERISERQRGAVEELDSALDAAHAELPAFGSGDLAATHFGKAQRAWQEGLFGAAPYVRDREVLERYDAAGWALLACSLDAGAGFTADMWLAYRAIRNAGNACSAFVPEEEVPPASFPSRQEAAEMAPLGPKGRDTTALHEWLQAHPEPEFTAPD